MVCVSLAGLRDALLISQVATLPENFDTPMFWTEEDLKELDGTAVVGRSPFQCVAYPSLTCEGQTKSVDRRQSATTTKKWPPP